MSRAPFARETVDLRRRALTRTILALAGPAVVENLLVTAVFFADAILVGWLRDDVALAAVGLGGTIMFIFNGLLQALAVGATALVARAWGERDFALGERVAGQALMLSLPFALLLMGFTFVWGDDLLRWMGATAAVSELGGHYLRIVMSTGLLSFPMLVASGVMRGAGDTRTPMWLTLIMNGWNVAAAVVLVFGLGPIPALGVTGAGWAAASARALGGILSLVVLFRGRTVLRLRPASLLQWSPPLVQRIARVSWPNLVESAASRVGYTLFMSIVTSLGTTPLAGHQIAIRVESLSFMPGWGLSVAAATLAGQALGAGDEELAEQSVRRTLGLAIGLMGLLGVFFALFGRQVVTLFGSTPQALAYAGLAVRIAAVEQPFLGAQMVLAGALRGAGDTRTPMLVTLLGTVFLRVAIVYTFVNVFGWGLAGVWWGTAVDWAGRSLLLWVLFRRGRWKEIEV